MSTRDLLTLLIAMSSIIYGPLTLESSELAEQPATAASSASGAPRKLHPLFERYEGGTAQTEARLIRSLTTKFALLQAGVGAKTGGNKRGTHANGFCLEGQLEIYDQKPENKWLQIGPFRRPLRGDDRPTVRIRFADASSKPQPNTVPDVRSVSFSFEVKGQRQDFSMNNDPVFTFGNLTDFNNFMSFSLLAATLPSDAAKAAAMKRLDSTNPDLMLSVMKAMFLGGSQKEKHVYAYHTENYYSGSAFRFGPKRAAKFSLIRDGGLPPLRKKLPGDANGRILVERTTNAVNGIRVADPKDDKRNEFCFELEVQILDVTQMKVPSSWKQKTPPTAIDWVEDATLNWNKAGAKSYKLGKLTAVPNSIMCDAECEGGPGFDANGNSWDVLKPLGNINRARYYAEQQSQKLRVNPNPAPSPAPATFKQTKAIDQGWNTEDRDVFWYLPQGSYIIPYDWFMALTDPETKQPLRDRAGLERFGFIHEDVVSPRNPDKLPIGLTRESPPGSDFEYLRGKGDWLGITCAACHVGSVTVLGTRHIIDGAASTLDLEEFSLAVEKSLDALIVGCEFIPFQQKLAKQGVSVCLDDVKQVRDRLAERNTRSYFHGLSREANIRVKAGPGRTDAFGVILNEVASRALGAKGNARVANAPVSFSYLWGAPIEDWVQYSGLSNNAFTRNVGQVLGVFGDVVLDPAKMKSGSFLATTARFENLQTLEDKLRTLKPPKWEQLFGPFTPEEHQQINRGATVFHETCARCHKSDPKYITMVPAGEFSALSRNRVFAGTDPLYFVNLKRYWSRADTGFMKDTSVLGVLRKDRRVADLMNGNLSLSAQSHKKYKDRGNVIEVLADTTMGIMLKYMTDEGIPLDAYDQRYRNLTGGTLPSKQSEEGAFKARSLEGIAFTGPYFHNGSVRTLRGVVAPEHRETEFYIGGTGYDEENGGFENAGSFLFRANKFGNLNIGHDFGADLSADQQEDLLMYLKSL